MIPSSVSACCHGKSGFCRFVNAAGTGCRFGEDCRHCHTCKRVTTFDRIKLSLSTRRLTGKAVAPVAASGIAVADAELRGPAAPRSDQSLRVSLSGLLSACQELFLEGPLGEALAAKSFCALLSTHAAAASLARGSAELVFWRLQLRRLRAAGLCVAPPLLEELASSELRRAVQALSAVRCKGGWNLSTKEELLEAADVAEAAREHAEDGAQLFGVSVHFAGRPAGHANEEAGGVDDEGVEASRRSTWVEGGRFTLPDGAFCQLAPRIMWFSHGSGEQLRRVILSNVHTQGVPAGAHLEVQLWSAMPRICKLEALNLLQTATISDREVLALTGSASTRSGESEEQSKAQQPEPLRIVAAVLCTQRFWQVPLT
ncbi:unnamed protein product [Polarella glacialis]|uniref:C3H1-type domain-containing protein n=1 Tax=Polarella glacialis TaxID=89957 RepID=A0A813HJ93_POLGL|nr:unnamed protein product [Polarella glacialis]